jgi:itaconyl-CoA hydratase
MASKTFARKQRITMFEDIAMTHPVFGGDTLYSKSTITGKESIDSKIGSLSVTTEGINQKGDIVATIKYKVLVYKLGQHPVELKNNFVRSKLPEKFSSHSKLKDGSFIEQIGIYFEDLEPGETYIHRPGKTFSKEECKLHSLRSIELCPQYANEDYANRYNDGRLVANEPFVLATLTALSTRTFDRVVANLGWNNIQMHESVCAGDTIYATSTILDKRVSGSRPNQGIMHVKTEGHDQNGKLVCSYERFFLIYKKGLGPYESAGY